MKTIILWFYTVFTFSCLNTIAQEIPDSMLTKDHVYELSLLNPEKAEKILDKIREKKKMPEFMIDIVEGDLYYNNGRLRQALISYKRAMQSDSVQMNDVHYMEQLQRLISCYSYLNDVKENIQCIELLMKKAEATNNKEMQSVALFNMGKVLYYQQDKERAYQHINNAIAIMKKSDYKYKYDNLRYNYNSLLMMQKKDKLYKEALQTLDSLEKIIYKVEDVPYIKGHITREQKNVYAHRAVILSHLKQNKEAKKFYEKWKSISKISDNDVPIIMPYLFNNEMYNEIIRINKEKEEFIKQHQDSISMHMLTIKRQLAKAYWYKGEYKKSAAYFEALAVLGDSIKIREQKSTALELATMYEIHEKDIEIKEQRAKVERRNTLLMSSITTVILLVIVLIILYYNIILTKRKNKVLAKNIKEIQHFKEEHLMEIRKKLKAMEENTNRKKMPTDEVYIEFCRLMIEEKIYLNPNLTRDDVVYMLNTNKNILVDVLKKNTDLSFSDYINELRLEDSLLLLEHMDATESIEVIAERVGFSKSSFYRLFKEKYGMTPAEYRNQFKT